MTRVTVNGISFNCADGEPCDMGYFCEGHPLANDTGEMGMVEEMKAFIRVIEKEDLVSFLDIGALFGVFSLVFCSRNVPTMALAVEPSKPALEGLMENVAMNPEMRIATSGVFCSEKTGDKIPTGKDWKHLVAHTFLDRAGDDVFISVGTAIDDFVSRNIDCMKIDVEGFECPVLRGARRTIEKCRPIIFLECHLQSLTPAGETPEGLWALVTGMGYTICKLDDTPLKSFDGYSHARVICYPK